MSRGLYRGPYAGLSIKSVKLLMGSSYYMAKKKLKELKSSKEELSLDDIGALVFEYRKVKKGIDDDETLNQPHFFL